MTIDWTGEPYEAESSRHLALVPLPTSDPRCRRCQQPVLYDGLQWVNDDDEREPHRCLADANGRAAARRQIEALESAIFRRSVDILADLMLTRQDLKKVESLYGQLGDAPRAIKQIARRARLDVLVELIEIGRTRDELGGEEEGEPMG